MIALRSLGISPKKYNKGQGYRVPRDFKASADGEMSLDRGRWKFEQAVRNNSKQERQICLLTRW
jgi:hypothetical protein